ncbi:hypothetical protein [Streptomyces sp. NPDC051636]|uniref:hypothetical protein n=1 Tax=Streptomyces sp. NPDC051636 TaxID=3365663 RepID=UPI0037B9711B
MCIAEDTEGLVHVCDLAKGAVREGQELPVRILETDRERRRIRLATPWPAPRTTGPGSPKGSRAWSTSHAGLTAPRPSAAPPRGPCAPR